VLQLCKAVALKWTYVVDDKNVAQKLWFWRYKTYAPCTEKHYFIVHIFVKCYNRFSKFSTQLAINWLLNTPPHINCVATLLCNCKIVKKLTIGLLGNKHVGKRKTVRTKKMQRIICTMLCCVRSVSLHIWRVKLCVCFCHSCLSGSTSSSTVVTLSSVRACFTVPLLCFWSVLPVF